MKETMKEGKWQWRKIERDTVKQNMTPKESWEGKRSSGLDWNQVRYLERNE